MQAGDKRGTFATMNQSSEPPSARSVHDVPPSWDGRNPETALESYLKLLAGWLATTRMQKCQMGMTLLHYASGDLRLIINELTIEELTAENSGSRVFDHVKEAFSEYVEKKLPKAIESAPFYSSCKRRR